MVISPSSLLTGCSSEHLLFIVPGCTKCDQVKSKLKEFGIPFQMVNIFEHRQLLKHVPKAFLY
ncbi:glutaredoxin domain-containing protein [Paenisporosarcina sp. TG20]|uniref:glutaredoxin domain-containing protein n=1 Tax=Paenisporosarcina sp. TG20 TaxID=1211706 RepID=UPI000315B137